MRMHEWLVTRRDNRLRKELEQVIFYAADTDDARVKVGEILPRISEQPFVSNAGKRLEWYTRIIFDLPAVCGVVFSRARRLPRMVVPHIVIKEENLNIDQEVILNSDILRGDRILSPLNSRIDFMASSRVILPTGDFGLIDVHHAVQDEINATPLAGTKQISPYIAAGILLKK